MIAGVDGEQELAGSLNIYSHTATAFDSFDAELMRLYSVAAGQAISNSSRWQKARETVTQLETALLSRSDIDMAKGALIALHGCDPLGRSPDSRRIPKAQHQTARRRPRTAEPNADEVLATAIHGTRRANPGPSLRFRLALAAAPDLNLVQRHVEPRCDQIAGHRLNLGVIASLRPLVNLRHVHKEPARRSGGGCRPRCRRSQRHVTAGSTT